MGAESTGADPSPGSLRREQDAPVPPWPGVSPRQHLRSNKEGNASCTASGKGRQGTRSAAAPEGQREAREGLERGLLCALEAETLAVQTGKSPMSLSLDNMGYLLGFAETVSIGASDLGRVPQDSPLEG